MSSKREEERNEKIIRGLMKLPPNRRCINCNSLGPQYVCTNFWTFVCITCSGIHREFTHRVKSVSMSKFTSQEVDSLQKGGNQRARELYLPAWDPQRERLPNNSNVEKVREFIKNVYVNRKYSLENSAVRPPRDPQGLRNHEDEKRRASSYHSYSQSPPYDFEYEERRYGKHAPGLTRKPGSERALYDGKISSFSSPSRFSDQANEDRFGDEGSYRASDFSVSNGGDAFRSDSLSPSSQRDTVNTFSSMSNGGRTSHSQRTGSGSFGSFDSNSMSFKSVNSAGFPEVSWEPERAIDISDGKSSSLSSHVQSSTPGTYGGLDLFDAPFARQNVTSQLPVGSNNQLLDSSSTHPVDLFQQHASSLSSEQQPSQTPLPSLFDLFSPLAQQQSVASSNGKISNEVVPNEGGWATFDMAQNSAPVGNESLAPAVVPVSDQSTSGNVNPFSFDQSSSNPAGHEPASLSTSFWYGDLQNAETATSTVPVWNAFENSAEQHPIPSVPQSNKQVIRHYNSNADKFPGFSALEGLHNAGNVERPLENRTPSGVASHINKELYDFSMVSVVAAESVIATEHKSSNPFDVPYDSDMGAGNMHHDFWDMSSLQASLPNAQNPAPYVADVNQSWLPQNPAQSYTPGGVTFDHSNGHLGLMASQVPNANIVNMPAQGAVAASVGGNPFA